MGSWPEVGLSEVRRAFKNKHEVYEEIAFWVAKGWRVRAQGHKFGLYPPDPGMRLNPPFVRVDGSPSCDATWQARTLRRQCKAMEQKITDEVS